MTGALIILAFLIVTGVILRHFDKQHSDKPDEQPSTQLTEFRDKTMENSDTSGNSICCGLHQVCDKTTLSPYTSTPEYFDDEELDRYRGRNGQDYTDSEIEEFRDILLTMREKEVATWARALQVREIPIPQAIREEIIMIVDSLRQ
ncbi:MAG: phospholipase [Bacteroides sp.]|nr:phospholipase [Bacteroides sp.]